MTTSFTVPDKTATAALLPLGRYRHYKGQDYWVHGVARHSETEEVLVVYQCLYGECGWWVRPLSLFQSSVEIGGEFIPRFAYLGSADVAEKTADMGA